MAHPVTANRNCATSGKPCASSFAHSARILSQFTDGRGGGFGRGLGLMFGFGMVLWFRLLHCVSLQNLRDLFRCRF